MEFLNAILSQQKSGLSLELQFYNPQPQSLQGLIDIWNTIFYNLNN